MEENIKFFYNNKDINNDEDFLIPGQNYNNINNKKIYIINPKENKIYIKINNLNENFISTPISLNSIGLISNIECINKNNKNNIYEFTLETKIKSISPKLDIYTTISTIYPKYIIYNKSSLDFYILFNFNNTSIKLNKEEYKPINFNNYNENNDKNNNNNNLIMIRGIEEENNINIWNWSFPFNLNDNYNNTIQLICIKDNKRKYFNIEKKIINIGTIFFIIDTNINNTQYYISNKSINYEFKIFQQKFELEYEYLQINQNKFFSIRNINNNNNTKEILKIEIYEKNKNSILKKIKLDFNKLKLPIEKIIDLLDSNKIKIEIIYDGIKKIIKFSDFNNNKIIFDDKNDINNNLIINNEINIKINQLGISLISDNKKNSSNRNEIFYITFKNIHFYFNNIINNIQTINEIQLKINYIQIDNMIKTINNIYPIVLKPGNLFTEDDKGKKVFIPFFNIAFKYLINKNNEPLKIIYFNYLIQSFDIFIDNDILKEVITFSNNLINSYNYTITNNNKSKNDIENDNNNNHIENIFNNTITYNNNNKNNNIKDKNDIININNKFSSINPSEKIFIQNFTTSPITFNLTFKASETIRSFLTYNPFFSSIISTFSNIENFNITLPNFSITNLYISPNYFLNFLIDTNYNLLFPKIFSLFFNTDVFGNPNNFIFNIKNGFKDFFTKPIKGMFNGPLEGIEGTIEGSYSLISNTINSTFNATSLIANSISKGIIAFDKDENEEANEIYNNNFNQPKNFVEGIAQGVGNLTQGIYTGVMDIIEKPVQDIYNYGWYGIGSGLYKGIRGGLSKPIVGMLQMVRNTSEGIKNTFKRSNEYNYFNNNIYDNNNINVRFKRILYGKNKRIKNYNSFDSYLFYFICYNKIITDKICFINADYYINNKGDYIFILLDNKKIFFIDKKRKKLIGNINYDDIKDITYNKQNNNILIQFKNKIKNKENLNLNLIQNEKDKLFNNGDSIVNKINKILIENKSFNL